MPVKKTDHLVIRNVNSSGQYLPYEIMSDKRIEMFRNQVSFNMFLSSFNNDAYMDDTDEHGFGRLHKTQETIKAWCNKHAKGFWSYTNEEIAYNNDIYSFYFELDDDKQRFVKHCLMMIKLAA